MRIVCSFANACFHAVRSRPLILHESVQCEIPASLVKYTANVPSQWPPS